MSQLSSISSSHEAASLDPPTALQRLRVAWRRLMAEWRLRRDLRQIAEFDSYMLKDIGLGQGGLEHAVRHGRSRGMACNQPVRPDPQLPPSIMPVSWTEWR